VQAAVTMEGTRRRKQGGHVAESPRQESKPRDTPILTKDSLRDVSQSSVGHVSSASLSNATVPVGQENLFVNNRGHSCTTESIQATKEQTPSLKGLQQVQRCDKLVTHVDVDNQETFWEFTLEVFIPFIIAGFGMALAGLALDTVRVCTKDLIYQ
jgi:hypothetical protein